MTDHFNEITKNLNTLGRRYDLSKVFNDLLTMSICSFHQTHIQSRLRDKDEDNEALYLNVIKPYERDDLDIFAQCLGLLQLNVLDNPYSDILGEYFMQHITRGQNGQYFTPEPICDMMAKINAPDEGVQGKRVLDPACGSGRMLLSYAKLNHRNYFFGADNNNTCAKMATVNFFLNGLKGEVAWMNSLTMEWFGGWHINAQGVGIIPIEKEQSTIWSEAPKPEKKPDKPISKPDNKSSPDQLTLF